MITLIVGRAENGAIGRNGTIPWDLPEDLKFFQRETLGGALVMGRSTWESLPVKPLPRRYNLVVSSNPDVAETVVSSVDAAIELALQGGYHRIYGIGGAGIYKEMFPRANRLLISEVAVKVPDADTFFPDFDVDLWELVSKRSLRSNEPACVVHEYLRKGIR